MVLFLAASIGFADPVLAQYAPQSQYNPRPQYNPSPQYNPQSQYNPQYNSPRTYQGNQGYPGGQQGGYPGTRLDAPMASNSTPDRTAA
jgi:hypothetical protein